ncbi:MAG: NYN domain-containing protein [Nanoarchaeota archaeon]|nr:NYN domain-containing protein [Nanoarchaeota archaeon]
MVNIYKNQRIGVFVDLQNMYYSAKNLYQKKVNFDAILKEAINGRTLIRAIAYVIHADELKEKSFFDALYKIGFDVKAKDLQIFYGGMKKGDWDVGIAIDCVQMAEKLDVVVLVSGDGDYKPLVEYLKNAKGCRVECVAFGKSASRLLKDTVDEFIDLEKNPKKYLLN